MSVSRATRVVCAALAALAVGACGNPAPAPGTGDAAAARPGVAGDGPPADAGARTDATAAGPAGADAAAFLDDVQERTFRWFWEVTPPANGLTPDRWPTRTFSSIAAVGFALTAYPIGVERGWISREQARQRVLNSLEFFWNAPQGPDSRGVTGHNGFFYHFLEFDTGLRHQTTELSTIDTTLLLAGMLVVRQYFDDPRIRALADSIYRRVNWEWIQRPSGAIAMAWRPERGFSEAEWIGYNEAMLLYVLALGSPTHPIGPEGWEAWTSGYDWGEFYGYEFVQFAPLFGHQYSHVYVDFRGIRDAYMRDKGIDYFENSRRAALAQRAYARDNPGEWEGYGADVWGLTASDGPAGVTLVVDGRTRRFHRYWARGAAARDIRDDGTIAPSAAGGSIVFTPEASIAALMEMRERWGEHLYGEYGFHDAFNLTFPVDEADPAKPRAVPGVGWFDIDHIGIDQGPIVAMIENHRSELVWDLMKRSPYVVRGLCRIGFRGGWLEGKCEA